MRQAWTENASTFDMIRKEQPDYGMSQALCFLSGLTVKVSESTQKQLGLPHGYCHFVTGAGVFHSDRARTWIWQLNPHLSESELSEFLHESQMLEARGETNDEGQRE